MKKKLKRYQIIPKVLKKAKKLISGLDSGELYNKDSQDALGIYLVTMKRPKLGKYLFSESSGNKSALDAGNRLAFEFASIRLQTSAKKKIEEKDSNGNVTKTYYITVPKHVKYYGGVGPNKQGKPDQDDAGAAMVAINNVRVAIRKNAEVQAIYKKEREYSTSK